MKNRRNTIVIVPALLGMCFLFALQSAACAQTDKTAPAETSKKAEIMPEETTASVPALKDLHEVVYPLWHTAYPKKDYAMIKELLPEADELTAKLDEAKLPGILRDKQAAWDEGKAKLKASLQQLHAAVEANNEEEMLKQTEAFHAGFEGLVRTIRPMVPELDAFHQELYKLYHYYAPEYDLTQIRAAAAAMQEKVAPLKKCELPKRLADREKDFKVSVNALDAAVADLVKIAKTDDKEKILSAVETVHTAYVQTEHIFD